MVVSKTKLGSVTILIGTDGEVAQALSNEHVPGSRIISVGYNGSNTTARYFAGGRNIVKKTIGSRANIV